MRHLRAGSPPLLFIAPFVALISCAVLVSSCKRAARKESGDNFSHVESTDQAMNAAIETAKKTTDNFLQAFRNPQPTYREFYVKKPYPAPGNEREHMWIGNLREVGDHFEGIIANDAEETKEVKFGQSVSLKLDEISDWKYLDGNRLIGGYTIRYFYERMNEAEKKAFLKEAGFVIE